MRTRHARSAYLLLALCLFGVVATSANAIPMGSNLRAAPDPFWSCGLALILDPITGAPTLAGTGQQTCTFRNAGYLFSNQLASYVPSSGFITRIRVNSGPNPAPLRLTILQGSPGLCCTAKAFGRVFRPRPNARSQQNLLMRVIRSAHRNRSGGVAQVTDIVGLTAIGPGSLPLRSQGTAGTFTAGSSLSQFWYPLTQVGVPRNFDTHTIDGIEILMQANFERNRADPLLR